MSCHIRRSRSAGRRRPAAGRWRGALPRTSPSPWLPARSPSPTQYPLADASEVEEEEEAPGTAWSKVAHNPVYLYRNCSESEGGFSWTSSNCSDPIERGGVRVRRRGTRRARPRTTSPAGGSSVRDSGTAASCSNPTRVKLRFRWPFFWCVLRERESLSSPIRLWSLVSVSARLADEDSNRGR